MTLIVQLVIALLSVGFAIGGAIYGSRREHAQWLRNARVFAYQSLTAAAAEMEAERMAAEGGKLPADAFAARSQRLAAAQSAVLIAGPASITAPAIALTKSVAFAAREGQIPAAEALATFVAAARSVLGSDGVTPAR